MVRNLYGSTANSNMGIVIAITALTIAVKNIGRVMFPVRMCVSRLQRRKFNEMVLDQKEKVSLCTKLYHWSSLILVLVTLGILGGGYAILIHQTAQTNSYSLWVSSALSFVSSLLISWAITDNIIYFCVVKYRTKWATLQMNDYSRKFCKLLNQKDSEGGKKIKENVDLAVVTIGHAANRVNNFFSEMAVSVVPANKQATTNDNNNKNNTNHHSVSINTMDANAHFIDANSSLDNVLLEAASSVPVPVDITSGTNNNPLDSHVRKQSLVICGYCNNQFVCLKTSEEVSTLHYACNKCNQLNAVTH